MKKSLLIITLLAVFQFATFAQSESKITLKVDGILSNKGELRINVFNSVDTYLKVAFKQEVIDLKDRESYEFEINGLPHGTYAISVVHDENSNGKLDFGGMGPEEGYGFSNNPNAMYGPAPFDKAVMTLSRDTLITIELN